MRVKGIWEQMQEANRIYISVPKNSVTEVSNIAEVIKKIYDYDETTRNKTKSTNMACYISAGHHKKDPGAVAHGLKEADLTIKVRDKVVSLIKAHEYKVITDDDDETLAEYLKRIQPGEASVVCEFHFDAASSEAASGTSAFYADQASDLSKDFARMMCVAGAEALGIPNRGAHSETESHRGRLGLVHEPGINCLVEVAFITNEHDIESFEKNFEKLCQSYANIIMKYDDKIK